MEEKEKGGFLKAINNIIKKKAESCTGVPAGSQLFLWVSKLFWGISKLSWGLELGADLNIPNFFGVWNWGLVLGSGT